MDRIIQNLQRAIREAEQDENNLKSNGDIITSILRTIARQHFQQIKQLPVKQIFDFCDRLLESGDWQERAVAFQWAFQAKKHYQAHDFERFERWLDQYVDGWGSCDDFCTHTFGHLIYAFPEHIPNVKAWTPSENRWFRRGAAVVMIYGIRRGQEIEASFEIADQLLMDVDDLVQKGYGWMLKEISKSEPKQVFDFVMQRKALMPRTSLRYAIEKLSPELRQQAMVK
jgi:3-methyladenine DNA glycosylase AlkD